MRLPDMVGLALENFRRTLLRTVLTILGVVIGIGALTSMVSFGTGMQKNITDAFADSDLFTTLFVTSRDLDGLGSGDVESIADMMKEDPTPLTDSTLAIIRSVPGVRVAFPDVSFPVRIRLGERETRTTLQALPPGMGDYRPYSSMENGSFYESDTASVVVIRWETLRRMDILVRSGDGETADDDTSEAALVVPPDSILGRPLEIVSAVIDPSRIPADPRRLMMGGSLPFSETSVTLRICGILDRSGGFTENRIGGGVVVPSGTAESIPRLGFSSVWELLGGGGEGYSSIYVKLEDLAGMEEVRRSIEDMGLHVMSISDEIKEIRRAFLILDSILGAIGTIALVVAALGIANTMVMSILERRREIGIMKAIGGSEGEIRTIFFVEAATIGVVGAAFGIALGWSVTRLANLIVNTYLLPEGELPVSFFYFPAWLILGAIGFSVLVSLAAGLYPAFRAARVDPVTALRHD
jgi:putative ABC transport system permease protein